MPTAHAIDRHRARIRRCSIVLLTALLASSPLLEPHVARAQAPVDPGAVLVDSAMSHLARDASPAGVAQAIDLLRRAAATYAAAERADELASTFGLIAGLHARAGAGDTARATYERALAVPAHDSVRRVIARQYAGFMSAHARASEAASPPRWAEARARRLEAARLYAIARADTGVVEALFYAGQAERQLGNFPAAVARFREVAAIARRLGAADLEGTVLNTLGLMYYTPGYLHVDSAAAAFHAAAAVQLRRGESASLAVTWYRLGNAFRAAGMLDSAGVYLERAAADQARRGDVERLAATRRSIGEVAAARDRAPAGTNLKGTVAADEDSVAVMLRRGRAAMTEGGARSAAAADDFRRVLDVMLARGDRSRAALALAFHGIALAESGRPDSAIAVHRRLHREFRDVADSATGEFAKQLARSAMEPLLDAVNDALELGLPARIMAARPAAERLVAFAEATGMSRALAHMELGLVYHSLGDFDRAIESFARARTYRDDFAIPGTPMRESLLISLAAGSHRLAGRLDSAQVLYERAYDRARVDGHKPDQRRTLGNLAQVHADLGRPDTAIALLRTTLALAEEIRDTAAVVTTLQNLAVILPDAGSVHAARDVATRALAMARAHGDTAAIVTTLNALGEVERRLGRSAAARAHFVEALRDDFARAARRGDPAVRAVVLANLGNLWYGNGSPDSAVTLVRAALAGFTALRDVRRAALARQNLALAFAALGRADSALHYLGPVLRSAAGEREPEVRAKAFNGAAEVYRQLNRPDSAMVLLREAQRIAAPLPPSEVHAVIANNLGLAFQSAGQLDSAAAHFRNALRLAPRVAPALEPLVLTNAAQVAMLAGRTDSVAGFLTRARTLATAQSNQRVAAIAWAGLGEWHLLQDRRDSSIAAAGTALALFRESGDRTSAARTLLMLGVAHGNFHRMAAAPDLRALPAGTDMRRAAAYFDSAAAVRATLGAHAGSDASRLAVAEESVDWHVAWAISWLLQRDEIGAAEAARRSLAAVESGRAQALVAMMTGAGDAGALVSADSVSAMVTRIAGRRAAALVAYLPTPSGLVRWSAAPGKGIRADILPVSEDTLAALVGAWRSVLRADRALGARGDSGASAGQRGLGVGCAGCRGGAADAGRRLAELLIPREIRDARSSDPAVRELIVVPMSAINLVPVGALPIDTGGTPLLERIAVRYAPSIAALHAAESAPAGIDAPTRTFASALVVGDPETPSRDLRGGPLGFRPLSHAREEAAAVGAMLGVRPMTGSAATEAAVTARLADAEIVHLSTHGLAYAEESRTRESFIALAPDARHDGLLTVDEILRRAMDAGLRLRAELVVLSACQTALGEVKRAEGTVGMQRAFLAAGARSVLVTLWSVDDAATRAVVERFYRHWLEDADRPTRAEALRRAQADVRNDAAHPHWRDPFYWGAFQLVGAG